MGDLDRIETNFRLSLLSQRETNAALNEVASSMGSMAEQMTAMATQMSNLAGKVQTVAEQGEQTAERLEDSIEVMKSFAEGQVDIRQTLAEYGRRLDALEGKQAS